MTRRGWLICGLFSLTLLSACGDGQPGSSSDGGYGTTPVPDGGSIGGGTGSIDVGSGPQPPVVTMRVSSPAVTTDGFLPALYCAFGGNQSIPLSIAGIPTGTTSLAVICDDPDAVLAFGATYAHWLLVDLPSSTTDLAANADTNGLPTGTRRGITSGGTTGWEGPSPPTGETHRYRLSVFALSVNPLTIDLTRTWTQTQFEMTYSSTILSKGVLTFRVLGPPG